jgi:hypothetical protein
MFILAFIVMFGPKKGTLAAYSGVWDYNFIINTNSIFSKNINQLGRESSKIFITRYHYTSITSRLTSYFLFSFWLFFFFYGESLLLIIFNYSTLVDTVSSTSFFTIKQHVIFFLITTPAQLTSYINFYIYFLTSCSFLFLLNFNYSYNYNYFRHGFYNSVLIILITLFYSLICIVY